MTITNVVGFGRAYHIVCLSYYLKESIVPVRSVFTQRGKKSISHLKKYFPTYHNQQKFPSTSFHLSFSKSLQKWVSLTNSKWDSEVTHVRVFQRKNSICHHPPHSCGGIFAFMPVQVVPRIRSLPPPFNLSSLKSKKPLLLALETAVPTFCYLYGFNSKLSWIMSSPQSILYAGC